MPQSRRPTKEAERNKLKKVIAEWNASRLDMFAMSDPSEDLEFHGVMRFFFQDTSHRVATKCVRVSSTATTQQVVKALVERFRPDMKMLTATAFSLFEVFSNGDEHQLKANDKPLLVQLNWHKDDREGRFLLRRDSSDQLPGLATAHLPDTTPEKPISFKVKRQLSKKDKGREKRDNIKERTQSVRLRPTSTDDASLNLSATGQASVAEALYDELPESTLMRSISNPEAVMRRRRQQKFEKKLQLYRKNGENSGDLLRVYAEMLCPEFPYKTLLVTVKDTAEVVVKEAVDKFGLGKQNWKDFYLVLSSMSVTGAKRTWRPGPERVIEKDEFPLKIKQEWASMKSEPSFHLRKRPCFTCNPTSLPAHQYKQLSSVESNQETSQETDDLPYLIEVTPEGHMTPDAVKFKLQPNVTQIGAEQARSATGGLAVNLSQLLLPFADIQPRHCKLASMSGVVTLTPLSPQAVTFINGERVSETTLLQNRSTIQFGNSHTFLYVDPRQAKWPVRAAPPPPRHQSFSAVIHSNGLVPQQHKARTLSERSSSHPVKTTYNGQPQEVAKSDFNVSYPSESAKQKVIGPGGERRSLDRSAVNDASTHIGTSAFMKPSKTNMRTNSERRPSASSGDTSNPSSFHRQSSLTSYPTGRKKSVDSQGDIKHFDRSTNTAKNLSKSPPSQNLQPPITKTRKHSGRSQLSSDSDSVFDSGAGGSSELPALLAFGDYSEDSLLNAVVRRCNGAAAPFKLAPAYVLYLCAKYRLSPQYHSVGNAEQGAGRLIVKMVSKAVTLMAQTVQESAGQFGDLCFWLANSSEFLHFLKMDGTLADPAATVTMELEGVIQTSFYQLVDCLEQELCTCITSFLEVTDTDNDKSNHDDEQTCDIVVAKVLNDIPAWIHPSWQATNEQGQPTVTSLLSTLSRAMALMRCCRVNAAFTIQLFSHAFHYINAWLFNKLVREPRLGLCCRAWGERLRKKLQRLEDWAERQGLELAVECHMAQVMQVSVL